MWPIMLVSIALNVVAPASRDATAAVNAVRIHGLVNNARAAHGLPPLHHAAALADAARRHSHRMARAGRIFHSPSLHAQVRGWPVLGQNVGMASSANDVVAYFLASPSHRALIMDDGFRNIGAGVVYHRGTLFVTVYFGGVAP